MSLLQKLHIRDWVLPELLSKAGPVGNFFKDNKNKFRTECRKEEGKEKLPKQIT